MVAMKKEGKDGSMNGWKKYCTEKKEQLHLLCGTKKKAVNVMCTLDVRVIWLQLNSPSCVKVLTFLMWSTLVD